MQVYGMTEYAKGGAYGGGIHTGIDIAAGFGREVFWPVKVDSIYHGWEPNGYGNFAVGTTASGDQIWFGHFQGFAAGALAGYVGSTGNSTGPHTHFEVRRGGRAIDPTAWLNEQGGDIMGNQSTQELERQVWELRALLGAEKTTRLDLEKQVWSLRGLLDEAKKANPDGQAAAKLDKIKQLIIG